MDNSPEMIARARESHPAGTWILADAATWDPGAPGDLVFSNAALQWLPNHDFLIPRLMGLVAPGGCLAVQVPAQGGPLIRASMRAIARLPRWRDRMGEAEGALVFHEAGYYYDLLGPLAARVDLWETTYHHVLASHQALVDWFESTGMRPYLDRLPDEEARADFKGEVLAACRGDYPPARDGKVIMPFRRLFFVAWK
jgi:trans-aconitate 2-methyltransferase